MNDPERRAARRVDGMVARLLRGKRAGARAGDATERDAITAAARLVGARESRPRMSPEFRRRLVRKLQQPPGSVSRRLLLGGGAGLTLGTLSGGLAAFVLLRLGGSAPVPAPEATPSVGPRDELVPKVELGHWIDTGLTFALLEEGVPERASAGAVEVFVTRHGKDVVAMSAHCTHLACELRWRASTGDIVCPCHGRTFTAEGMPGPDQAHHPLPPLPMALSRIRNGRVEVYGTL